MISPIMKISNGRVSRFDLVDGFPRGAILGSKSRSGWCSSCCDQKNEIFTEAMEKKKFEKRRKAL